MTKRVQTIEERFTSRIDALEKRLMENCESIRDAINACRESQTMYVPELKIFEANPSGPSDPQSKKKAKLKTMPQGSISHPTSFFSPRNG